MSAKFQGYFKSTCDRFPRPRDTRRGVRYGPANAVDGLRGTFWEVAGIPFPIALELEFPTPHTLAGYSLSTVEATERMPSSWEVCVSSDRVHWRRLQEMTEGQPWKNDEIRHYHLEPTPNVTGLKLVITGTDDKSILRLYEFRPEFATLPAPNSEREIARDASRLQSDTCTKAGEVSVTPQLLYAHKDYNITRAGEFYVGVAQELGPTDVDAVLTHAVPRPPATKFIVSNDTSSLESAIDQYVKDTGAPHTRLPASMISMR